MTLDGNIHHDVAAAAFVLVVDGHRCVAAYRLAGRVMQLVHTEVHPSLQGRGIAARLVKAALDHARANALQVDPVCTYVCAYMRRHPDSADLRA